MSHQNNSLTHNYRAYADAVMAALREMYDPTTGLFGDSGDYWWTSANELEAVIDYCAQTGNQNYLDLVDITFRKHAHTNFINRYYDDEGWWALTWIKAYNLLGEHAYLAMAQTIFADMTTGWDDHCGGGLWWNKDRGYKNAIPNELFLTLAARLYQRVPTEHSYLDWANREWQWFLASGMLNNHHLVNDGLNEHCQNNGQATWTYNQGVILGGLVDLYKISGDVSYLQQASSIADAAIQTLVNEQGILREPCEPHNCGRDGWQFKGIFMRNLAYLASVSPAAHYKAFIMTNAAALWHHARNPRNQIGLVWYGPFDEPNPIKQGSALDALNAAIPFGKP